MLGLPGRHLLEEDRWVVPDSETGSTEAGLLERMAEISWARSKVKDGTSAGRVQEKLKKSRKKISKLMEAYISLWAMEGPSWKRWMGQIHSSWRRSPDRREGLAALLFGNR